MFIDDKLQQIKSILESGNKPDKVSVRTLLSWVGAERRGLWVVRIINDALEKAGLVTSPHFDSTYIDNWIEFNLKTEDTTAVIPDLSSPSPSAEPDNIVELDGDEIILDDPTYRIEKLEAANKDLTSVNPQSELKEAITKMIMFDYSQLP